MKFGNLFCIILLAFIGLINSAPAKTSVAVFEFDPVGIDQPTAAAATQIFRSELESIGKYSVFTKGDIETRLRDAGIDDFSANDVSGAVTKSKAIGADKAVIGSLTQLGNKIMVEVQLIDIDSKKVEFADRFSSDTIDDLDVVLQRLARAVASKNKVESDVNRFALTEAETGDSRHRRSYMTSGMSFGFGFPLGDSSYSGVDNLKALAWNMRYEANRFVVDNSVGVNWGTAKVVINAQTDETENKGVFIIPWDIGLRYLLIPESDISPYIGAGLGFHFIFAAKVNSTTVVDGDQAMALHFATGLYAFQSYDFRLSVDAKYTIVFSDAFYGSDKTSQQIGISIGISRKWVSGQKRILFIF